MISVRTGSGQGRTLLAAFDAALGAAGVANFNLIRLSSVIPPTAQVVRTAEPLVGGHGDRLFCVYAAGYADHPGEHVWAGLGWVSDPSRNGLFAEHTGGSRESVDEQVRLSLEDMSRNRGGGYERPEIVFANAHCTGPPVCAIAIAAYQVESWTSR